MRVIERIEDLRAACDIERAAGRSIGLVPTMGYFHSGHRSLMRNAREGTDFVVVTLFVNPMQFGPDEDLDAYPRDIAGDLAAATEECADVLFMPSVSEMYPLGPQKTTVGVSSLTEGLCGRARPHHFDGVTTVVTKLFNIVGPSAAYFGRKDFQQLAVLRWMVRDLDLPVEVIGCPLIRENDGLAMSSRNAYLSSEERAAAPALFASLVEATEVMRDGERDSAVVEKLVSDAIGKNSLLDIEYVEVCDALTLQRLDEIDGEVVIALAAGAGRARLIDNVVLRVDGLLVEADLGMRIGLDPSE